MIIDIFMAFVMACIIKMFDLMDKYFRPIVIFTICITLILIYFLNENTIHFIGDIDFAIWIIFVILFDIILNLLAKIEIHIK